MSNLYSFTQIGFALLTLILYALFVSIFHKALRATSFTETRKQRIFNATIIALITWAAITGILSWKGVFRDFSTFPPKLIIALIVPFITIVAIVFTKTVKEILQYVPSEKIIRLQSFRIIVELLLWMLFIDNLLPVQMTFEGRNWDILAGLSAPIVALLIAHNKLSKTGALLWNIVSLGLLINIVTIAILSLPGPLRAFHNEPPNTIVSQFPVIWLPSLLVPLAYGLHFLSIRQLVIKGKATP